jgi:hypothetical protein
LCGDCENKQEEFAQESERKKLQNGEVIVQYLMKWSDKKNMIMSRHLQSKNPDHNKEGERKTEACVCDSL